MQLNFIPAIQKLQPVTVNFSCNKIGLDVRVLIETREKQIAEVFMQHEKIIYNSQVVISQKIFWNVKIEKY